MATQSRIWDRNDKESDQAWEAFEMYRESDPPLKLSAVASKLGKSYDLIRGWSSKHNWRKRRNAHQAHLDSMFLKELDKNKVRVRRQQLRIGEKGAQLLRHEGTGLSLVAQVLLFTLARPGICGPTRCYTSCPAVGPYMQPDLVVHKRGDVLEIVISICGPLVHGFCGFDCSLVPEGRRESILKT